MDDNKRRFYEKECENAGWSVREMKRQIASSLFERLLLSKGEANYFTGGKSVRQLAQERVQ